MSSVLLKSDVMMWPRCEKLSNCSISLFGYLAVGSLVLVVVVHQSNTYLNAVTRADMAYGLTDCQFVKKPVNIDLVPLRLVLKAMMAVESMTCCFCFCGILFSPSEVSQ